MRGFGTSRKFQSPNITLPDLSNKTVHSKLKTSCFLKRKKRNFESSNITIVAQHVEIRALERVNEEMTTNINKTPKNVGSAGKFLDYLTKTKRRAMSDIQSLTCLTQPVH